MQRREFCFTDIKLADDGSKVGTFSGYGAFFGNEDSYGDVIEPGAFTDTLKEWKSRGKLPKMLLQHGGGGFFGGGSALDKIPVGRWTHMSEDAKGLKCEGELFALDTERGRYIYEGVKSGELDGLSVGFMIREARNGTKPGEPERYITDIDLWEVSLVTFPANPKAQIMSAKTISHDELRDLESDLREAGLSRRDVRIAVARFRDFVGQCEAGQPARARREDRTPEPVRRSDDTPVGDLSALLARINSVNVLLHDADAAAAEISMVARCSEIAAALSRS